MRVFTMGLLIIGLCLGCVDDSTVSVNTPVDPDASSASTLSSSAATPATSTVYCLVTLTAGSTISCSKSVISTSFSTFAIDGCNNKYTASADTTSTTAVTECPVATKSCTHTLMGSPVDVAYYTEPELSMSCDDLQVIFQANAF